MTAPAPRPSHYTQPDTWQSAWRRVLRGRERLRGQFPNSEEYDDALYHFYQDAWHLKDWLKNDQVLGPRLITLEDDLKNYDALMIAADMANGTKHRLLTAIRAGATVVAKDHIIRMGNPEPVLQVRTLELKDGSRLNAADVADRAIQAWMDIFASHGLNPDT